MSEDDFKDKMYGTLNELKLLVVENHNDTARRLDKQDVALNDLQDQIKGNPDKDIKGIVPKLKELYKVLYIQITVYRLPKWAKVLGIVIAIDVIGDVNSVGIISLLKYLLKFIP